MNMFARFDENPALTLQDIKKNKMLVTDARTDTHTYGRTDNVKTVYPPQTKFAGGIMSLNTVTTILMNKFTICMLGKLVSSADKAK